MSIPLPQMPRAPVAPKYRDAAGNTWTGRGKQPVYGSRPNRAALYGMDALVWAGYWWAARRPGWRMEWFGYVRGVLSARQAWSNYRTEC